MTTMGRREIPDIEGIRRMQAMEWRLLGRVYTGDTETAPENSMTLLASKIIVRIHSRLCSASAHLAERVFSFYV